MPSSTTSVMPSSRTPRTNSWIAGRSSSSLSAIVSQPSRSSSSGVPGGAQSVPSLRQMRRTTSSRSAWRSRSATGPSSSGGRSASNELGRPVTIASRLASMPESSLFIGTTNASMPSRSSWSVTSSRSIPASASAARSAGRVLGRRGAGHLALARGGLQRRQRHRVDGVRRDEAVHVERVGIRGVLDAGRGPERALDRAAGVAQRGELLAAEHLLERPVGGARVGEPGAPLEVLAAGGGKPLVDLRVDARDEERRDRMAVERQAFGLAAPHRADVGPHHVLVGPDAEQQRDVDVHPLVQGGLDRRDPLGRGGDLDHQVGPVDEPPVHPRLLERPVGVVRQPRRDLERDVAVEAAAVLVHAAQHVGGELHVAHREPAVDLARRQALGGGLGDVGVVVGRAEDRLLEDRRVRRDPAERVLLDHPGQLAALDHAAADLVEPDARPGGGERREALVDRGAHAAAPSLASTARARSATAAPVNPKCS